MNTKCQGLFGRLLGHHYEARYSLKFAGSTDLRTGAFRGSVEAYERIVGAWKNRVYEGDVCRRCGHVINKTQ